MTCPLTCTPVPSPGPLGYLSTKEENKYLGLSGTDTERVKVPEPRVDATKSVGVRDPETRSPSGRGRDLRRGETNNHTTCDQGRRGSLLGV